MGSLVMFVGLFAVLYSLSVSPIHADGLRLAPPSESRRWPLNESRRWPLNDDDEFEVVVSRKDVFSLSVANPEKKERTPIVWAHVHKHGGTFMCSLAREMQEAIVQPSGNCNFNNKKFDGVFQMGQRRHHLSCAGRKAVYREGNFSYGQIEREYNAEDIACGADFLYGTMLREPLGAMRSTARFHEFRMHKLVKWLRNASGSSEHAACGASCEHRYQAEADWHLFDNFVVRSFNGYRGWKRPVGKVTAKDLTRAKRAIAAMDVLMILENLSDDAVQLSKTFGWASMNLTVVNGQVAPPLLATNVTTFLAGLNKHDMALYAFAREVAAKRTAAARGWE